MRSSLESVEAALRGFVEPMPATRHLGIRLLDVQHGVVTLEMECRRELTFDGTTVQGGIVAVLADYAGVAAAFAGSDLDEGWLAATIGCETHNLLPATGERLVAEGSIIKAGRRHMVSKADVHIDSIDGPLCLTGLFTAVGVPPISRCTT